MNLVSLKYRTYKRTAELQSAGVTGRASWIEWLKPDGQEECPPLYGWYYEYLKVGDVPELDDSMYVATLAVYPTYPYQIEYVWALSAHHEDVEVSPEHIPVVDIKGDAPSDLYFVRNDGNDWDLYSVSGKIPDEVVLKMSVVIPSGERIMQEYVCNVEYVSDGSDPGFEVSPSTFTYTNNPAVECNMVGDIIYDNGAVARLLSVEYDAECSEPDCPFFIQNDNGNCTLYTRFNESERPHEAFAVPLIFKYIDGYTGKVTTCRKEFKIHGMSAVTDTEPYVKYIRNMASKVGESEQVQILGEHFEPDMSVRIQSVDGAVSIVINSQDLVFDTEGKWDRIGFVLDPSMLSGSADTDETCGIYLINVGYGGDSGFIAVAGSYDAKMLLENNVGLIRYKYDESNSAEQKKASAGTMVTTDSPCFYSTDLTMVFDADDGMGNAALNGGAAGKYGKTIYLRMNPRVDCENIRYVKVKLKYNKRLDYRHGEMVLNGISLTDGDIVWLAGQMDESAGLWIVRSGADWDGLKDYVDPAPGSSGYDDPCTRKKPEPLPVDDNVFIDLGARVDDKVDYRCSEDVPEKYGRQTVCGQQVEPGDIIMLSNQSDGMNGVWEVTCSNWVFRGYAADNGGTTYNASDMILYQNNIDFCACRDGHNNPIFGIEYYYLNAGCYLAKTVRKVKLICSTQGALLPNNRVVVTDYSITAGTNTELVVDTHATAGDGKPEDCTKPADDFEKKASVQTAEVARGCGEMGSTLVGPDCNSMCDCPKFYELPDDFDANTVNAGFSLVFWQFGEGGWHLFAYIAKASGAMTREYTVYHLRTCGTAVERMVDENSEVEYVVKDETTGIVSTVRTHDAWFVEHGGVLADGFGMYDQQWMLKAIDADGKVQWRHELDAETLYQAWTLHGTTTKILAHGETIGDAEVPGGMNHLYGFRFYSMPITIERFCQIYNAGRGRCACQDTWSGLVTDQCYDSEGHEIDCNAVASEGNAFITGDDGDILIADRSCYDEFGRRVEC